MEAIASGLKNTEIISILKRRNTSSENVNENLKYTTASAVAFEEKPPSIHSQTFSDTSLQRYDVDISNDDDDDDDDESDSDWDAFQVNANKCKQLDNFIESTIPFLFIAF